MANELDAIRELRKRVAEIANDLKLDVSLFSLVIAGTDEKPMLQVLFGIRADAVKSKDVLEQEFFDSQFADIESQFGTFDGEKFLDDEDEDEVDVSVLDDLKSWMDDDE